MTYKKLLKVNRQSALQADSDTMKRIRLPDGRPLPKSYQDFCSELGFGKLFNLFEVFVPLKDENAPYALQSQIAQMKLMFLDYIHPFLGAGPEAAEITLLEHAVPFARSDEGQYLYWDLSKSLENGEYPIRYAYFSMQITGTPAGNSMAELIENMTCEKSRDILIFNYRPLKAVFSASGIKDLAPNGLSTVEDYEEFFIQKILHTPFKKLVAFGTAVAGNLFTQFGKYFGERKRSNEGEICEKSLAFLNRILHDPDSYTFGEIDHHKKELTAAIKVLSRKRKSTDHIDAELLHIADRLITTIYFLKTRDLIYMEGMITTTLHQLADNIGEAEAKKFGQHPVVLEETQKWIDNLSDVSP